MAYRFRARLLTVLFVVLAFSSNAVRAGTTGGLSGRVLDGATPVAQAKVAVVSPSQSATTTTDAGGRFSFVSLAPDTYTLSIEKNGYDPVTVSGVTIAADSQQTQSLTLKPALRTIGRVSSRAPGSLVSPGTTADVYSVNSAQQDRVASLGGGGNLNSAYSAIASVPGAYVPLNQTGYNQALHIRGGDSGEVGYELDGIPVNRGFDNFPSGSVSSLGQQELQVYTGASPADSEAQGLSGSINQVIKTGSYPAYARLDFGAGSPAFYHSLNAEIGGANQRRTFSYYVAVGGFNQDHRYVDQFNARSLSDAFGPILFQCPGVGTPPPSCFQNGSPVLGAGGAPGFALGSYAFGGNEGAISDLATRSTIVNLHFGIPHGSGGIKDDVQLLYDNDQIWSSLFSSALDEGRNNVQSYGGTNSLYYTDSWQYNGALGTLLPNNYQSLVTPYFFPSSPQNRAFGDPIPLAARDVQLNAQSIVKLQYQKNFSSAAYLRLYGYTYYSNYIATGPNSSYQPYTGLDSGDYEVSSHTRGLSASFVAQIAAHHLLDVQASYTASTSLRQYNEQMFGSADNFAVLVNPSDLTSGTCYAAPANGTAASATTCNGGATLSVATPPTFATLSGIGCATHAVPSGCQPALPSASGLTCGSGPCAFYVIENGRYGPNNAVKPIFTGYSVTDQFKPTDKLTFNLGLRLDRYTYTGADTTGSPARAFLFNAYNKDTCYNTQSLQLIDKTSLPKAIAITAPCSTEGPNYQAISLQNVPGNSAYNILQPRFGVTYSVGPNTVLRASYGKYNEQPSAAYEQYDALQQNLPDLLGPSFYSYGFATPGHAVRPSISYNADFSLEHHFENSDVSLKLTPFLRQTHDQVENFVLNQKAGLVSGLNIGQQTSRGFEFALSKGDFGRNGFASTLSFAYTNSYVNFAVLPNGSTIVSSINGDIKQYNAYSSFCNTHASDARCGGVDAAGNPLILPTNGSAASPCYAAGVSVACNGPGAVAIRTGTRRPNRCSIRTLAICRTRTSRPGSAPAPIRFRTRTSRRSSSITNTTASPLRPRCSSKPVTGTALRKPLPASIPRPPSARAWRSAQATMRAILMARRAAPRSTPFRAAPPGNCRRSPIPTPVTSMQSASFVNRRSSSATCAYRTKRRRTSKSSPP